jgi:hypothetical protein
MNSVDGNIIAPIFKKRTIGNQNKELPERICLNNVFPGVLLDKYVCKFTSSIRLFQNSLDLAFHVNIVNDYCLYIGRKRN